MGVSSGLELLTLPHGHQLRLDLLERYEHAFSPMAFFIHFTERSSSSLLLYYYPQQISHHAYCTLGTLHFPDLDIDNNFLLLNFQVLHHVYHDGGGPARLYREHRGEGSSAP